MSPTFRRSQLVELAHLHRSTANTMSMHVADDLWSLLPLLALATASVSRVDDATWYSLQKVTAHMISPLHFNLQVLTFI